MTDKLMFELVSPERLLIATEVEMVVVPGTEGDFGVLAGHAPFMSAIRPGVIDLHDDGVVKDRVFVSGGFAEVSPAGCTILAEAAIALADLSRDDIERTIKLLAVDLDEATTEAERHRIEQATAIEQAKLEALPKA